MVTCVSAINKFNDLLEKCGGDKEKNRAKEFIKNVVIVPDDPSDRIMSHHENTMLRKIVAGTADKLGYVILTGTQKFFRDFESLHGVFLAYHCHDVVKLTEAQEIITPIID